MKKGLEGKELRIKDSEGFRLMKRWKERILRSMKFIENVEGRRGDIWNRSEREKELRKRIKSDWKIRIIGNLSVGRNIVRIEEIEIDGDGEEVEELKIKRRKDKEIIEERIGKKKRREGRGIVRIRKKKGWELDKWFKVRLIEVRIIEIESGGEIEDIGIGIDDVGVLIIVIEK